MFAWSLEVSTATSDDRCLYRDHSRYQDMFWKLMSSSQVALASVLWLHNLYPQMVQADSHRQ